MGWGLAKMGGRRWLLGSGLVRPEVLWVQQEDLDTPRGGRQTTRCFPSLYYVVSRIWLAGPKEASCRVV